MNKEEILAIKAGRNLDKAIAEAFGYRVYSYLNDWRMWKSGQNVWRLPKYSTGISAAWQVVEKIRSDDSLLYRFGLALSNMSLSRARELGVDYIADLMRWLCPEAICKAALLAKLHD